MEFSLPITDPILQFTALVCVIVVVQLVMRITPFPPVVGLLVAGMLIGPGGGNLLDREPVVELLGSIGLIYVMFIAGLEIDLNIVRERKRETGLFGVASFVFSLIPAVAVGLLLGMNLQASLLLAALVSSHTLLSYPMAQRMGLTRRRAVVTAVGGTIVTDTLALILLAIVIQTGGVDAGQERSGSWWLPLVLLAGVVAVSLLLVPRLTRLMLDRENVTRAEKALYVLAVLVVLSATADLIGTEKILGAFLAGLCLNRSLLHRQELREHVEFAGKLLFVPFFFVSTGMLLELEVFTGHWFVWMLAGLLVATVLLGKSAASIMVGAWYGYRWRDRMLMIGLTIPQAAATLAVAVTARQLGLFQDEIMDAVILLIFVTCLLGPLLTAHAGKPLARPTTQPEESQPAKKMGGEPTQD
jgi:Kef-type K+ transport system membrane component KefB